MGSGYADEARVFGTTGGRGIAVTSRASVVPDVAFGTCSPGVNTASPMLRAPWRVGSAVDENIMWNMDEHRSQIPQGPEGKADGTLLVAGTAKAGPSTKQPSRVQPTQQGSGTTKVEPPSSTSGGKAAKSILTSANTHTHGGGAAKVVPPHTKRKSVGGRGETGKP